VKCEESSQVSGAEAVSSWMSQNLAARSR